MSQTAMTRNRKTTLIILYLAGFIGSIFIVSEHPLDKTLRMCDYAFLSDEYSSCIAQVSTMNMIFYIGGVIVLGISGIAVLVKIIKYLKKANATTNAPTSTLEKELVKLGDLKSQGIISEEEYNTLRHNLIEKL